MQIEILARVKYLVVLVGTALFSCACQTSDRERFDSTIRLGMDKSTVVETVGGPTVSRRWKGKDRWIYRFRQGPPENHETREVHFENGRVVYVGKEVVPDVSAEEQDRINEAQIAEDFRRLQEENERRNQNLGIITNTNLAEDPLDRKLRESLYGIPASPELESRKRPMVFEPIQ